MELVMVALMQNTSYRERILNILSKATMPLDVEFIRVEAEIKNWQTAISHLLQLVIEGKICGQKTTKGWIFWMEKNRKLESSSKPFHEKSEKNEKSNNYC